jgi:hypothetical protein
MHGLRVALLLAAFTACDTPATCEPEGGTYDLKLMDAGPCCEGLTAVNTTLVPDGEGGCAEEDLNPAKVCIDCGDGTCDEAENACSCPADCAAG